MKLPPGVTEQQVLDSIERAARILAPIFKFGVYGIEDIRQEARLEGCRVMAKYDSSRPLDNYIYRCLRNYLIRLKRDKFRRNDPPCMACHRAVSNRTEHEDGQFCPRHLAWKRRNDAKANLAMPVGLDVVAAEQQRSTRAGPDAAEQAEYADLLARIDDRLDVDLRADYLRLRAGKALPGNRRVAVENAVREILGDEAAGLSR